MTGGQLLGYARVSTRDQDATAQVDALGAAGCTRTWIEVASGAKTDRPELAALLAYARPGDTIVIPALDRLGPLTVSGLSSARVRSWCGHRRGVREPLPNMAQSMAILLSMETRYPLAEARNNLSDLVSEVEETNERITITKHGRDAAVLIARADLDSLEATIEVLSRDDSKSEVLRVLRQAEEDLANGKIATLDDLAESLRRRGLRPAASASD